MSYPRREGEGARVERKPRSLLIETSQRLRAQP